LKERDSCPVFFTKTQKQKKKEKRKEKAFSFEAQPTTTNNNNIEELNRTLLQTLKKANEEELWKLKYYFTVQKL
jgi:D-mannonate dehydratase